MDEMYHRMEVLNPTTDLQEGELAVTVTRYPTQLLNEPQILPVAPTPPNNDPAPQAPQSSTSQGGKQDA